MIKPASPHQLAERAQNAYSSTNYLSAAKTFAQAAAAYAAEDDMLMAAEMRNNQSVALLRLKEAQAALDVVKGTDKVFAVADDFKRQGMALANQAAALEALRHPKEAIPCYRRAAAALEKAGEGDLRADVMQLLSMLYFRRFRFLDAIIALQSGLSGAKNPTSKQRWMKRFLFLRLWR